MENFFTNHKIYIIDLQCIKNIFGKLYFKLYIKSSKVANGYADLFEQTTDINVTEVEKIVLQKDTEG